MAQLLNLGKVVGNNATINGKEAIEITGINDTEVITNDDGTVNIDGSKVVTKDRIVEGLGYNPSEVFSNPNLLVNPDFKINQRGLSEYNSAGYTVDRWYIVDSNTTVQLTDTGVRISNSDNIANFSQIIDNPEKYAGKTVTMSCYISEYIGQVVGSGIGMQVYDGINHMNLYCSTGFNSKTVTIGENASTLVVSLFLEPTEKEIMVEWAKLELGSVATPFVTPDPLTEKLKCGIPDDTSEHGYKEIINADTIDGLHSSDLVEKRNTKFITLTPSDIEWHGSYYLVHANYGVDKGLYIKNETSETLNFKFELINETDTPYIVQLGHGTGVFPEMQSTGKDRENFVNYLITDTACIIELSSPPGKTAYIGFYCEEGSADISIRSIYCIQDYYVIPASGYTTNANTIDGLHVDEIGGKYNLLDNPDFKINQRGQMEYTEDGYTVDRWIINAGSVSILDNGISIKKNADSSMNNFIQNIKNYNDLIGKTVTLSISTNFGNASRSVIAPDISSESDYDGTIRTDTTSIHFDIINGKFRLYSDSNEFILYNAQLQLGSVATPFVPPNPAEELLKIQSMNDDGTPKLVSNEMLPTLMNSQMVSNPNLLINPDFKINQRGQMEYTTSLTGDTVDGWKFNNSTAGTLTIADSYIHINISPYNEANGGIIQLLENAAQFVGKTVTASAKIRSDTSKSALRLWMAQDDDSVTNAYAYHNGDGNWQTLTTTITVPEGVTKLSCEIEVINAHELDTDRSIDIAWAKLELGSVATPFTPPDPATELTKCQRYYMPAILEGYADASTPNDIWFHFPLPTMMRVTPSLDNVTLMITNILTNTTVDITDWAISVENYKTNGLLIRLHKENHGLAPTEHVLTIMTGGLSAEL